MTLVMPSMPVKSCPSWAIYLPKTLLPAWKKPYYGIWITSLGGRLFRTVLTAIEFPVPSRAAYQKFPNPASRYAIVGVLVADFAGSIRVGVTGAGPCAFRALGIEQLLNANLDPGVIERLPAAQGGREVEDEAEGVLAIEMDVDALLPAALELELGDLWHDVE